MSDFESLVRSTYRDLYRYFRLSGADAHEAEDCVQETFLRIHAGWRRYEARAPNWRPLLYRVARSVWIDALRRCRRRPLSAASEDLDERPAREAGSAESSIERFELLAAVRALPERLRSVVILTVYQGLDYREAAEALGIPLGTVKSRMHFALKALRESAYGRSLRVREL